MINTDYLKNLNEAQKEELDARYQKYLDNPDAVTPFDEVKKRHGQIFEKNDEIKLHPRTVTFLVAELQKYALLSTDIDIKGKAYEEIVGANLRGDRGEFFTPRNVMKMAVAMINPKDNEKVLDSSCGTGGFVVTAMNLVIDRLTAKLEKQYGVKAGWSADVRKVFNEKRKLTFKSLSYL